VGKKRNDRETAASETYIGRKKPHQRSKVRIVCVKGYNELADPMVNLRMDTGWMRAQAARDEVNMGLFYKADIVEEGNEGACTASCEV
jgi:hypothetical protein